MIVVANQMNSKWTISGHLIVVTSISVRTGLSSLSSPPVWTSVIWATYVKLSREDTLFVLQAKSYVPGE